MRHFGWGWIVASSLMLASVAGAATRPQYGGVIHIAMRETPRSLNPSDASQSDSLAWRNLMSFIFETLVVLDDQGRVHPSLAMDWKSEEGNQRWRFRLRRGVRFQDGSPLTPEIAASSIRSSNPSWKVFAEDDFVVIESEHQDSHVPAELALLHNGILKNNGGGKLSGTGPFYIEDWQPGQNLVLGAEENHWRGRPFLDSIEIEFGRSFHDQSLSMELGKVDLIQAAPDQVNRIELDGRRLSGSQPMELLALVFNNDAITAQEKLTRQALAHSIDKNSIRSVLLQSGQPAASLLPNWMTGYGFAFPSAAEIKQAREQMEQAHTAPSFGLGYDANDSLARVIVERIVLNSRDVGLALRPTTATGAEVRLVRIPLASVDPWVALAGLAGDLGMVMPKTEGESVEDLYAAESFLMSHQKVIPLFYLPANYASSPALKGLRPGADGTWRLDEAWVENKRIESKTIENKSAGKRPQ